MRFGIEHQYCDAPRIVDSFPTLASAVRAIECRDWPERYAVRDKSTGDTIVRVEYTAGRVYAVVNGRIRCRLDDLAAPAWNMARRFTFVSR
jgi:hypothetical protein